MKKNNVEKEILKKARKTDEIGLAKRNHCKFGGAKLVDARKEFANRKENKEGGQ